MTPEVLLIILVTLPIIGIVLLRANAAMVFLSLCLGAVLVQFVGNDAVSFMHDFVPQANGLPNLAKILLVLLPPFLTTIFMVGTVKGLRLLLNLLPAVGTSLLAALLTVPLFSAETVSGITGLPLWRLIEQSQSLVVGASGMACLFILWLQRPKASKPERRYR